MEKAADNISVIKFPPFTPHKIEDTMSKKQNTALLSIGSNSVLIVMKLAVGIITGSVSIISEAIHSTMDLLAAIIAFVSIRISSRPADHTHNYGHEKLENISGVIEALLVFMASILIIREAVNKILSDEPVTSIGLGFIVMFISAGINFFVSRRLYKVARAEESIALEADALHLKVDVYTSLGVGVGLLLIYITKINFLDPVVAILIALFILKEAYDMLVRAFSPLVDARISNKEIDCIKSSIAQFHENQVDYHDLRTRRSGNIKHIDFHLDLPENMTVAQAHEICDRIENEIENKLHNTKILIHVEPRKI
mgnify:CR=1 FL=1